MKVFWRDKPLSKPEADLLSAVLEAHRQSTFRENPSSVACVTAFIGSRDFSKSIAAALMTIGGPHAPIRETMALLAEHDPEQTAEAMLRSNQKAPGWGSSFCKGRIDPIWRGCDELLARDFPATVAKIARVTETLHRLGKKVFPNPSCYTAAASLVLEIPETICPYLFIAGRLGAWANLILNQKT